MFLTLDTNRDEIKVRWRPDEDASDLVFTVSAAAVQQAGEDIRATLNDLNEYALKNPRFSEERDEAWTGYNTILGELKRKGRELYLRLLRKPLRWPESAELLEAEIRKLPQGYNLNVHCSGEGLTLPLGFVCDPDFDAADTDGHAPSRADFDCMWINRFEITWLLDGCRCSARQRSIDHESFRTLFALHAAELDKALAQLLEDTHGGYFDKFNALMELQVGKYAEWRDIRKACASVADFNTVVFVFAHAEKGATLHLGAGPNATLGCSEFADYLQRRRQPDKSKLVILNCCASVTSQESGSLLNAVTGEGFCGLVGTEAEILNSAALRCGIHLMWEMCFQGQSLGDAFKSMQAAPDLFPQNLFYSCYAPRKFQLDKPLVLGSNDEQERVAGTPVA